MDAGVTLPIEDFRKQRFLQWLCIPAKEREPSTMDELATELDVTRRTLTNWKKDDEFIDAWAKEHRRTVGNPDRLNEILDVLYKTAVDIDDPKHIQAAKEYRSWVEETKPQQVEVKVSRDYDLSKFSDAELFAMLGGNLAGEIEDRLSRSAD